MIIAPATWQPWRISTWPWWPSEGAQREKRGTGQSEGDLPGDATLPWLHPENPLRPSARAASSLAAFGRFARAIPRRRVCGRDAARRVRISTRVSYAALCSPSSVTSLSRAHSTIVRLGDLRDSLLRPRPRSAATPAAIFFPLPSFGSARPHPRSSSSFVFSPVPLLLLLLLLLAPSFLSPSLPLPTRRTSPFPSRAGTPGFLHLARSIPANEA